MTQSHPSADQYDQNQLPDPAGGQLIIFGQTATLELVEGCCVTHYEVAELYTSDKLIPGLEMLMPNGGDQASTVNPTL